MLRSIGIAHLDTLIVSHQDTDHSGGALSVLETMPVATVLSSLPADHPIVRARLAVGETATRCMAGDTWRWDRVDFTMWHPVAANYSNLKLKPNDLSRVIRIANAAGSALLTGDIEARTESDLVGRSADVLRSEVLVVPHHGSLPMG
jgi:competence protein ComEC